jgi:hypothetical protein
MRRAAAAFSCALLLLASPALLLAEQVLQFGFESRGPFFKPGASDGAFKVLEHGLTKKSARGGERSEYLRLQVEKGSYIHYTFDLPRAPVTDELALRLWLKANRPGVQVLCRLVLPRERDPNNASAPLAVLVRCDPYNSTRWKLISLREPLRRLREQRQLLTHKAGRDVVTAEAYIDQVVLNVCDGPGLTEVWVDDLEVGPVVGERPIATPAVRPREGGGEEAAPRGAASEVQVKGGRLLVGGKEFFLRGIRHTGTPMQVLYEAGINTLWLDETTPAETLLQASKLGLWVVPTLQAPPAALARSGVVEGQLTSGDTLARKMTKFLRQDGVLAWDVGSDLGHERFAEVARVARAVRAADPNRPTLVDVWDGFKGYSLALEQPMVGTHRWPLFTSLDLGGYRDWLDMRRRLSSDGYFWTWVQTHLPEWFLRHALEQDGKDGLAGPAGPHPEQVRLLTYCALAAGYRGVGFWADRFLADSHHGRDRLLGLALLNQELKLLEPVLTRATAPPEWIGTSRGEVKAAVFRVPALKCVLVLPIWVGPGSQFVPGQSATPGLKIKVPVPYTMSAWEVSPGRVRSCPIRRELGGTEVELKSFSLTSAVVFTSDLGPNGLVVQLQDEQRGMGPLAAQWLHDQAKEQLAKVEKVEAELARMGRAVPDSEALLKRAGEALARCVQHRNTNEHGEAYGQAEVALRAMRLLMRAGWDRAVRDLDTPVASPYALSYYTLPKHWELADRLKQMRPVPSRLRDGDFEAPASQAGWYQQQVESLDKDKVTAEVRKTRELVRGGAQALVLRVAPKTPASAPQVLERTYVLAHSPQVKLPPGSWARITVWYNLPRAITASPDGALVFDSACGEPMAARIGGEATKGWKRVQLYRKVPESGTMQVTLALSGLGAVYFDDVKIEPLAPATGEVASR